MPDTKSSVRWEQFDTPVPAKAFKAAGVTGPIVNAQNDPQKQKAQADQCIADGAKVLIIAPIDSGSAAAIEKAAPAKGGKSIDYDRQVASGPASAYIIVRRQQGRTCCRRPASWPRLKAGKYEDRSSPSCGAARRTRTRACSRAGTTTS